MNLNKRGVFMAHPVSASPQTHAEILQQQQKDLETKKLTILFWKNVAATALFVTAAVLLTALAVSLGPVGATITFGIVAAVCSTAACGGLLECRRIWRLREENKLA
jgi:hypothetical protein